jgi:hypothetical protein
MKFSKKLKSSSYRIGILLCIAIVYFRFEYPPVNILSWDVFGYYLYLPAHFIYHDLRLHDLTWVNAIVDKYDSTGTLYQLYQAPGGNWIIKESIGLAILNAPAFFAAHAYSLAFGYDPNGFSLPYQYAFAISGLIFACIGIFMLRKILLEYFDERTTTLVLLIIVIGTNHFQLTAFDGMLSHNYVFTMYTFLVWYTIRWHKEPRASYAAKLGLSMGLAILCRPSEMVCILIPLFWGIYNWKTLVQKWNKISLNWKHFFVLVFMMFLAGLPQLLYWKYLTGQWVYYTYNNPGEGFDFFKPYIHLVLFSFRKGWLVYTPVMAFALAGILLLFKKQKPLVLPVIIYFLINLWVVGSWTAWWYGGGSYSQRGLLSSYVILAIPLGYMIESIRKRYNPLRTIAFSILFLLIILNIFQTWQWAHGIIDKTRMTKAYYLAVFGKTKVTEEDRQLLMVDHMKDEIIPAGTPGLRYRQFYSLDYDSPSKTKGMPISDTCYSINHSYRVTPDKPYVAGVDLAYKDITRKEYFWIQVSVQVFPLLPFEEPSGSLVVSFEHDGQPYKYKAVSINDKQFGLQYEQWNRVGFDFLTPEIRSNKDRLKVYFWLQGKTPMLIDDFRIDMWEPIE